MDAVTAQAEPGLMQEGWTYVDGSFGNVPQRVIAGFKRFLDEPEELKESFTLDIKGNGDPDDGYIRRRGQTYDVKSLFHFRPAFRLMFRDSNPYPGFDKWLADCDELHGLCTRALFDFVHQLDSEYPKYGFYQHFVRGTFLNMHVLRLLSYDIRGVNQVVAKPHTDQGFLTIHVDESCPGLRLGLNRVPHQARQNQRLVFPGRKAERLTQGRLRALEHDVVEQPVGQRWSVVFFSHIEE